MSKYVAKINQTVAEVRLNATTERGAKAEASRWNNGQAWSGTSYALSLYLDVSGHRDLDIVAVKENGRWHYI
jgi:hypothetical protein